MGITEFAKHPATETLAALQRLRLWWTEIFTKYPPDVFATLTFDDEPSDVDAALGAAIGYGNQVSGVRRDVLQFMVTDRGRANDRLHLHGFLWTKDELTTRDLDLFRGKWRHGISDMSPFDESRGGIDYVASKIAQDGDFNVSKNMIQRLELWARMKLDPPTD